MLLQWALLDGETRDELALDAIFTITLPKADIKRNTINTFQIELGLAIIRTEAFQWTQLKTEVNFDAELIKT